MSLLKINVTQEDIDLGHQGNPAECAVARAILRDYHIKDATVSSLSVMLYGKRYGTSDALAAFVHAFDRDKDLVFPQEFLLDTSTPMTQPTVNIHDAQYLLKHLIHA